MATNKLSFKKGETIKTGKLSKGKKLINLWGEPFSGKTSIIGTLAEYGYNIDYINFDNNINPLMSLSPEASARINNILVQDSITKPNIAVFFDGLRIKPIAKICTKHGYIDCVDCKQSGEFLLYSPLNTTADLTVIDSASTYLSSAMIASKNEAMLLKTTFNHFGVQGLHVDTLLYFAKSVKSNVMIICHDIQMANTLKENYVDDYYPLLGTRPKSKTSMSVFTEILATIKEKDTYQVSKTKTRFADLRNRELEMKLKNKPRLDILKAILGEPNSMQQ